MSSDGARNGDKFNAMEAQNPLEFVRGNGFGTLFGMVCVPRVSRGMKLPSDGFAVLAWYLLVPFFLYYCIPGSRFFFSENKTVYRTWALTRSRFLILARYGKNTPFGRRDLSWKIRC